MSSLSVLELSDFKSFREAEIELSSFNLIVGANASGKSNVRDALRFLHGVARGYSLAETLGGRYQEGVQVWSGIRGGSREVCRHGTNRFRLAVNVRGYRYELAVEVPRRKGAVPRIADEKLSSLMGGQLYGTKRPSTAAQDHMDVLLAGGGNYKKGQKRTMARSQPALTRIEDWIEEAERTDAKAVDIRLAARAILTALRGLRFLDISPDAMRIPSIPGETHLGDRGENLSSVIQHLCRDDRLQRAFAAWVQRLTPMDVAGFDFATDAAGKILLELVETDGNKTSANSASDGTLRFLALLTALLAPDSGHTFFLEEIDNGIHPARLDLLMQLLRRQTGKDKTTVVATTHSPPLLRLLGSEHLDQAFISYRLEGHAETRLKCLDSVPSIRRVLEKNDLAALHESSWFQNVLAFTEDESEENGE
jgi:predicted ATPase